MPLAAQEKMGQGRQVELADLEDYLTGTVVVVVVRMAPQISQPFSWGAGAVGVPETVLAKEIMAVPEVELFFSTQIP